MLTGTPGRRCAIRACRPWASCDGCAAIVGEVDPDLVHLHSAKAGLAGRLLLRGRRPTVFQPHAWSFEATGGAVGRGALMWERAGARWADVIVCVSEGERRRGQEAGVKARYEVVPNGVDLARWAPAAGDDRATARAALALDASAPVAVAVGRLAPQKGQDVLLPAWERVLERVPSGCLVLVGDGPDRDRARGAARAARALCRRRGGRRPVARGGQRDRHPVALGGGPVAGGHGGDGTGPERRGLGRGGDGGRACGRLRCGGARGGRGRAGVRTGSSGCWTWTLADREGLAGRARVEERYDVGVASARMAGVYEGVLARRERS